MIQYATARQPSQRIIRQGQPETPERSPQQVTEPSRAELLAAIKGSREALEGQIAGVSIEVNLLRDDLCKFSDKVNNVEGNINKLQTEATMLKKQMFQMKKVMETLKNRVEDTEARSRRNIRLLGFPERAEGQSTERFIEDESVGY